MIFAVVLAFGFPFVFWLFAEAEVQKLRELVRDLNRQVKALSEPSEDDEDEEPLVLTAGDRVEVQIGSVFVKGKFVGVAMDSRLFVQAGQTTFTADPDDVWPDDDAEPTTTYRSWAKYQAN